MGQRKERQTQGALDWESEDTRTWQWASVAPVLSGVSSADSALISTWGLPLLSVLALGVGLSHPQAPGVPRSVQSNDRTSSSQEVIGAGVIM